MRRFSCDLGCTRAFRIRSRDGFSLIEVSVSTLLVGLIVVGAMRCFSATAQTGQAATDQTLAVLLAEELMEEILQQGYAEPDGAVEFGIDDGEFADNRQTWDDVDDYDDWSRCPPADPEGSPLTDDSWTRAVTVVQVHAEDLSQVVADSNDTGVKLISVKVHRNGRQLVDLRSIQTRAWISAIPEYGTATTTGKRPPDNQAPEALIGYHVRSGTTQVNVNFLAEGSHDPDGDPLTFDWDFGDGSTAAGSSVSHTFVNTDDSPVVFTVTLTVTDIHGARNSATSTVTVFP